MRSGLKCDATGDGLLAQIEKLGFNALGGQGLPHLLQGGVCTAMLIGTAVDQ